MINSKQIVKLGRKDKILEINDKLQVNDFYNETGYDYSTLHGRYSRIQLVIVDTKEGKKDKAKIAKYNFTYQDLKNIVQVLGLIPNAEQYKKKALEYNQKYYQKNNDYLNSFKINKYEKHENGKCATSNIKLSYENAMKNDSKWKITIDIGETLPEEKGNLIMPKQGSYEKLYTVSFNLTQIELEELIQTTWNYLKLWEHASFQKMLEYRKAFEERCIENNFDEKNMSVWNSNPNLKNKEDNSYSENHQNSSSRNQNLQANAQQQKNNTQKNIQQQQGNSSQINQQTGNNSSNGYKCQGTNCNNIITSQVIIDYSKRNFNGRILCMKCQTQLRKNTA